MGNFPKVHDLEESKVEAASDEAVIFLVVHRVFLHYILNIYVGGHWILFKSFIFPSIVLLNL